MFGAEIMRSQAQTGQKVEERELRIEAQKGRGKWMWEQEMGRENDIEEQKWVKEVKHPENSLLTRTHIQANNILLQTFVVQNRKSESHSLYRYSFLNIHHSDGTLKDIMVSG